MPVFVLKVTWLAQRNNTIASHDLNSQGLQLQFLLSSFVGHPETQHSLFYLPQNIRNLPKFTMRFHSTVASLGLSVAVTNAAYPISRNPGAYNSTDGSRPDRLEINDLVGRGGPQLDLFLLCLSDIQARPQGQQDSWYQIAGKVHLRVTP